MTTRYLGVDLAWSERSGSGVCALDETGRVLFEDQLGPAELPGWIDSWRGDSSVLALDGPLMVPAGSPALRPVERELHRRYGRYHAGPFPGGAQSTAMKGSERSPAMTLVDEVGGYVVDPAMVDTPHRAIEVFPAPTWIELFGLSERIAYKRGPKAQRIVALGQLRVLLGRLEMAHPPLKADSASTLEKRAATARTIPDWKAVEDIVDARLCAYIAQLWDQEERPERLRSGC